MYFETDAGRDRVLTRLFARAGVEPLEPGAVVWTVGEAPARCVLVVEGLVVVRSASGAALALAGPRHLIGLEAVGGRGGPYRTGCVAFTAALVRRADGEAVLRGLRRTVHTLPLLLARVHAERVASVERRGRAGGPDAADRLAAALTDLQGRLTDADGWLPAALTHELLGDLAGLHRSTVTTILNEWIYDGRVEQLGRRLRVASDALADGRSPGP